MDQLRRSQPPLRRQYAGVLAAAGVGGASFAPVFGLTALALPVLMVCLVGFAVIEACRRWPVLALWRPLVLATGGVLAIVETVLFSTTIVGVPTRATVRALGSGLSSWRETLESTWPARADPALIMFVPLLVLVAAVLGVEVLDRLGGLPAIVPSLAVIGVGQTYAAVSGSAAYLLAFCYAVMVALVLAPVVRRRTSGGSRRRPSWRRRARDSAIPIGTVVLVLAGVVGGVLVGPIDPVERKPYTLQRAQPDQLSTRQTTNPLDELASRLAEPETVVFRYRTDAPVDRWRLLALEDFDGANWTTDRPFLRLGRELKPSDAVQVPTTSHRAEIDLAAMPGPWLPSQSMPREVDGAGKTFVELEGDTLLSVDRPTRYTLSWYTREVTAENLLTAAVDPEVPIGDLSRVPSGIASLARAAVDGKGATFRTALALERYLATRYELATGSKRPTGHGWAQLSRFLVETKRGTSEQFAAAYVVLARLNGIPARLAVGFRAPAESSPDGWTTVRNRDALVWPEVAIDGIGWWPLDPAGLADSHRPSNDDRDAATEQARAKLPPSEEILDPAVPEEKAQRDDKTEPGSKSSRGGPEFSPSWIMWLVAVPPVGWVTGTPLLRWTRARHRRRRPDVGAVIGAWAEVRDRLRAHGVPVTPGMTVRDLATVAHGMVSSRTLDGLDRLARTVDEAVWSSAPVTKPLTDQAWAGAREVVDGLRDRSWSTRLRAALDVRSLLPP